MAHVHHQLHWPSTQKFTQQQTTNIKRTSNKLVLWTAQQINRGELKHDETMRNLNLKKLIKLSA